MPVNGWHLSISSKKEKEKERDEKIKAVTNNLVSIQALVNVRTCFTLQDSALVNCTCCINQANGFEKESKCQLSK